MRCFSSPGSLRLPMNSAGNDPKGPGFPIRRSADQRVLAPPRGFSQRATSFIASQCQGIHQMPLNAGSEARHRTQRSRSPSTIAKPRLNTQLFISYYPPGQSTNTIPRTSTGAPKNHVPAARQPPSTASRILIHNVKQQRPEDRITDPIKRSRAQSNPPIFLSSSHGIVGSGGAGLSKQSG